MPELSQVYKGSFAENYDQRRTQSKNWLAEEAVVVPNLNVIQSGDRVLDMPAGTGRWLKFVKDRGASVIFMDVSADMLGVARNKAEELGFPVETVVADALLLERYPQADCLLSTRFFNWIPLDGVRTVLEKAKQAGVKTFIITVRMTRDQDPLLAKLKLRLKYALRDLRRPLGLRYKSKNHMHREKDLRGLFRDLNLTVEREVPVDHYGARGKVFFVLRTSGRAVQPAAS